MEHFENVELNDIAKWLYFAKDRSVDINTISRSMRILIRDGFVIKNEDGTYTRVNKVTSK